MGAATSKLALRYPVLLDTPNVPQDIQNLAEDVDANVPVDSSNSIYLTGGDIAFTADNNKNILSTTIVLAQDQWVIVSARAMFVNASSNDALIGIYVDLGGGTPIPQLASGNLWCHHTAGDDRVQLTLPPHSMFLTAGTYTIRLRGDRDSNSATLNAQSDQSLNVASHPCFLSVLV